ncbi:hypothetical protein Tco_0888209 [Tanacetum coccineum]
MMNLELMTSHLIKLEDLSDILKDTGSAFFTPNSPPDEPIIVSDESKEEEEVARDKYTEATSHDIPKYTSLTELLVTSLKPKLSKLLASHDFASCLPTKLKELPSKVTELSGEIKELKKHVAELKTIQWELIAEFLDLPSLVSSVQAKLKTLDSLSSLLNKVTDTLIRFVTLMENASGATSTNVPLAGKATALPTEREKNTSKDAKTNLQKQLIDLLGIDVVEQYHNKKLLFDKYYDKMLKRRKSSNIINYDVLTQKGPISLKVYREDGTTEVIDNLKVGKYLHFSLYSGTETEEGPCSRRFTRREKDCFMSKGIKESPWENVLLKDSNGPTICPGGIRVQLLMIQSHRMEPDPEMSLWVSTISFACPSGPDLKFKRSLITILGLLYRGSFSTVPPAAIDAAILDPTSEDLFAGTPSVKVMAKVKASKRQKASTIGVGYRCLEVGDDDEDMNDCLKLRSPMITPIRSTALFILEGTSEGVSFSIPLLKDQHPKDSRGKVIMSDVSDVSSRGAITLGLCWSIAPTFGDISRDLSI